MNKVYKLLHDYEHLVDMDFDACHEPFIGEDTIGFNMMGIDEFYMPGEIYFRANLNVIPNYTDFPITDLTFPIFSKRMIDVLQSIKPFKKKLLKTIMIDDTYLNEYKNENGNIKDEVRFVDTYVGVQFLEYTDAFDYKNSIYKPMRSNPGMPGVIQKLVLKEPNSGFPPMFKIKENLNTIFLSDNAKRSLESINIKGCVFEEVEVSNSSNHCTRNA